VSAQRALPSLRISSYTASSCLGRGRSATLEALEGARGGLKRCDFPHAAIDTYIGEVRGLEEVRLPEALSSYDCRNNRLAELALSQDGFESAVQSAARRYGAQRIGVLIGTSTSGILQTELAYRHRDPLTGALPAAFNYDHSHNSFSVTDYVRRRLELQGPATSICTACSSSAKVFAAAQRLIAAELIEAAVVGGVDSLCLTTLHGFHSLQLTARGPCRPFDRARDGLSLAEAGAFALLERAADRPDAAEVLLLGTGESSDAYHMSSPHPEGAGALSAMRAALAATGLDATDIDYINLHGTGTPSNDSAEAHAVRGLFGGATACSSTKGATGHALGAAGALEAVICALALEHGLIPGGLNVREPDTQLGIHYLTTNRRTPLRRVLSNSFGFGGANCALLLGRAAHA
jgi:3-oxoacyl-[acyl-carrier-protein] synthase-1